MKEPPGLVLMAEQKILGNIDLEILQKNTEIPVGFVSENSALIPILSTGIS